MTDYEVNRLAPTGDPFLSPSRVDKVDSCLRAFGLRYNDDIRAPDKPSAAFGKVVHTKQQIYIITGVLPESELVQIGEKKIDAGKVAISGLRFLPLPHPSIKTEHEFEYEAFHDSAVGPIWFQGKIDLYDCDRILYQHVNEDGNVVSAAFEIGEASTDYIGTATQDEVNFDLDRLRYCDVDGVTFPSQDSKGRPIPLVIDHKTTGDFKWQKSADVLRATLDFKGDPQTGFYGEYAVRDFFAKYGELPEYVHFRWVYYLRSEKESKAKVTDLRLTPAEIREICNRWKENAERAIALSRSKTSGHELPPTLASCQKFGGCEFGPPTRSSPGNLNICRLTSGERMKSAMTSTQTPIQAAVAQALAAQAAGQPFVNPFAGTPAPAATGNPFQSVQSPEALAQQSAPAAQANPFASSAPVPAAQANPFASSAPAPAAQANPFASSAPVAAAQANPFASSAPVAAPAAQANPFASSAPVTAPAVQANPFASSAPAPAALQAPAVDPRLVECHPSIDPAQRVAFLALCDKNGLDHRTGQPKGVNPAIVPATSAQPNPAADLETYKKLAQAMYAEKRRPDASTHPEVARLFTALEQLFGAIPGAAVAQDAPKKRGRPRKTTTNPATGAITEEDDDSPQIVITAKAIDQIIGFLQSLKEAAPS